jgi:hypothetical protein
VVGFSQASCGIERHGEAASADKMRIKDERERVIAILKNHVLEIVNSHEES